ncbi:hypothetical protein K7432_015284 [Basidiobolus ranarum]|uniref:DASH complex subunit DAD3 n=1 Tax=Basidiobolus ranarum TaxID=34480 RepID=A0ABR2VNA3_9FUNG
MSNTNELREQLLQEYRTIAENLNQLNGVVTDINSVDIPFLTNQLRDVEKRFSLVYTLFKSSVYSVLSGSENVAPESSTNTPSW